MDHSCVAHARLCRLHVIRLSRARMRDKVIVEVVILSMSDMPLCTYPFIMFPIFHILETTVLDSFDVKARLTVQWTLTPTGACAWLFMDYFEPVVVAIVGGQRYWTRSMSRVRRPLWDFSTMCATVAEVPRGGG